MKLPRFFLFVCTGTILSLFLGCNDAPNPVGAGTQPLGDYGVVHVDTFYTTVEQPTVPNLLSTGSLDRMMLGKYQAQQNQTYEAWTCLKFYSWPDELLGVTVLSATIQLRPFYHFGDSLSSLSFDVFRAKASILGDSLTYDSLNLNSNYYYDNIPINTSVTIQASDTLCLINLDTAVVRQWLISNTDTTDRNDGLLLRPGNANVIKGFYSCNTTDTALAPTLYITYKDTSGDIVTYTHKYGLSQYVSHVDPSLFVNSSDGKIRVQNGISYQGLVAFPEISLSWSNPWSVLIHKAILETTLDSASSSLRFTPFENGMLYGLSVGTDNTVDGLYYSLSTQTTNSAGQYVFQFNATGIALNWLKNTSTRKFALSGYSTGNSFDLFTFYGAGSTIIQRPKMIITYSIKR